MQPPIHQQYQPIKVINIRKHNLRSLGFEDLQHWLQASPNHVYIGRAMTMYVPGAKQSKWANPFKVGEGDDKRPNTYSRDESLRLYEEWLLSSVERVEFAKQQLRGKVLGCWCKPEGCHGDVLKKVIEGKGEILGRGGDDRPETSQSRKKPIYKAKYEGESVKGYWKQKDKS